MHPKNTEYTKDKIVAAPPITKRIEARILMIFKYTFIFFLPLAHFFSRLNALSLLL